MVAPHRQPRINELPFEKRLSAPPTGWKPHTLYLVHVSYSKYNPAQADYLFVGFVDKETGMPAGYTSLWAQGDRVPLDRAYYLWPVRELHTEGTP